MNNLGILGLSDKEQLLYKALLNVGISSPQELSLLTELKRSTIYLYLEQLKQKGLVSELTNQKKKYFQAINPKSLKQLVRSKISELEKLEKALPSIIENLGKNKSKISAKGKTYQGLAGVAALVLEIANSNEDIHLLGSIKGLHHYLNPDLLGKIYNKPRRRKMNTDYLITDWASSTVKKYFEESGTFTKIRFLPPEIESKGVYIAFGSKLIVATYFPEPHAVVIEEPMLVDLFKLAFNALWKDLEGKNIPPR